MPLQNRVTPIGELIADPGRGLVYGNRGCLHDDNGRVRLRFNGKRWIACRLQFRGWHRHALMQPGRFTELFLLDEATAFAAGHRPCALCRREDYRRLGGIWRELHAGQVGAEAIDAQLHAERVDPATRGQRHHRAPLDELPDGAFVLHDGAPRLVFGSELLRWTPAGYTERIRRPARGRTVLITPPSLAAVLRAGWRPAVPLLHPSAAELEYGIDQGGVATSSPVTEIEPADLRRVGDEVDRDDPPPNHRESNHRDRGVPVPHDNTGRAVDEDRFCERCQP